MTTLEAGGGGYGDPARRSRDAVLADVRAGHVTPQAARSAYGVDVESPIPVVPVAGRRE